MAKRKRRNFTPEFKAEVVLEALRGESFQAETSRISLLSRVLCVSSQNPFYLYSECLRQDTQ